ncbi:MAG: fibrobacter succinogenes major paralogous domain-containing protein, partial [Deltaproteobacteria bacterium]|nr:fibrobacter succinogenes major paralogous domain-containing protein [Deltaproteobacteria bacterium]MBW2535616.1 fibrobacter succinogenes major paralogous domain-containing protein [Deltaproteobacteria bacterium]
TLLVDARDGRSYRTVSIGTQCWMAQNLDVGTLVLITSPQSDNGVIEKYCYGDSLVACTSYGGLYQWDEMMAYGPSDPANPSTTRGICPTGWHLPSDAEYQTLEMHLGMSASDAALINLWRGADVGEQLRVGGTSGFDAPLGGRCGGGSCFGLGLYDYQATSVEYGAYAWRRCLAHDSAEVGRFNTFPKAFGLSVRCALD